MELLRQFQSAFLTLLINSYMARYSNRRDTRKEPYLACKRLLGMWMGIPTSKVTGFAVAAMWDVVYWIYGVSLSQNPLVGLPGSSEAIRRFSS